MDHERANARRRRNLALLLYAARALGINMAWRKGPRGSQLVWIGVRFEIAPDEAAMKLTIPKKMLEETHGQRRGW